MRLSQIKQERKPVPVKMGEAGTLTVQIVPARYTRPMQDRLLQMEAGARARREQGTPAPEDEIASDAVFVSELLDGWDLEDDAGKPIPVTPEFFVEELGYFNLQRIVSAILGALNPNA